MHNRGFLPQISDTFADWIVVVAFYAAVRAVDSLLAYDTVDAVHSHAARDGILKRTSRYQNIWKHYYHLKDGAHGARYRCGTAGWFDAETAKTRFVGDHLRQIEQSVLRLRKADIELPTIAWGTT